MARVLVCKADYKEQQNDEENNPHLLKYLFDMCAYFDIEHQPFPRPAITCRGPCCCSL